MGNTVNIINFDLDKTLHDDDEEFKNKYYTSELPNTNDYKIARASWNAIINTKYPALNNHIRRTLPMSVTSISRSSSSPTKGEEMFWRTYRKMLNVSLPTRSCNYLHLFEQGELAHASPQPGVGEGMVLVPCLLYTSVNSTKFLRHVTDIVHSMYRCYDFKARDLTHFGKALCWAIESCLNDAGFMYTNDTHMAWLKLFSCAIRLARLKLMCVPLHIKREVEVRSPHKMIKLISDGVTYEKIRTYRNSTRKEWIRSIPCDVSELTGDLDESDNSGKAVDNDNTAGKLTIYTSLSDS